MAQREDRPGEPGDDSFGFYESYNGDYDQSPDENWYDPSDYDDTYVHWDDEATPRQPWHRSTGALVGVIATASAALAVAFVLLLTSGTGSDRPSRLIPTIRTTAATAPPAQPTVEPGPAQTTAETSAEETDDQTDASEAEGRQSPAGPAPAGEPSPTQVNRTSEPEGPQINVTRAPMSFTPGSRG